MADVSTLPGAITYFLYAIPVFVAIWIGLIQLRVQVLSAEKIAKMQHFSRSRMDVISRVQDMICKCLLFR